jgi:hypothetical protein
LRVRILESIILADHEAGVPRDQTCRPWDCSKKVCRSTQ